ncbi:MAG: hypothetical protein WC291_03505, partial [Thermodesulfovibrionales bacterium]
MSNLYNLLENHAGQILRHLEEGGLKRLYNASVPHLAILLCFCKNPFLVAEDSDVTAAGLFR